MDAGPEAGFVGRTYHCPNPECAKGDKQFWDELGLIYTYD